MCAAYREGGEAFNTGEGEGLNKGEQAEGSEFETVGDGYWSPLLTVMGICRVGPRLVLPRGEMSPSRQLRVHTRTYDVSMAATGRRPGCALACL